MKGPKCASILIGLCLLVFVGGARGDGEGDGGSVPAAATAGSTSQTESWIEDFRSLDVSVDELKNSKHFDDWCVNTVNGSKTRDAREVGWFLMKILQDLGKNFTIVLDSAPAFLDRFIDSNGTIDKKVCNLIKGPETTESGATSTSEGSQLNTNSSSDLSQTATDVPPTLSKNQIVSIPPTEGNQTGNGNRTSTEEGNQAGSSSTTKGDQPTQSPPAEYESGTNHLYWILPVVALALLLMVLLGVYLHRYTKRNGFQTSAKTQAGEATKNDGSTA